MRYIYNGKYFPLGQFWGFIKVDIDRAKTILMDWLVPISTDCTYKISTSNGSTEEVFKTLEPINYPPKLALLECANNWVALTTNRISGDASFVQQISKRVDNSLSIEVWICPQSSGKSVNGWGGGYFRLNQGDCQPRSMMLSLQDRGWEFDNDGDYLDFEETEKYTEKFAKNRFTPEMLEKYLKYYQIDFFNENFYMPQGSKAYIIETIRGAYSHEFSMTLEQSREKLGYNN